MSQYQFHLVPVKLKRSVIWLVFGRNIHLLNVYSTSGNYMSKIEWHYTRWFKYDRDCLHLFTYKLVPVIFEPPCTLKLGLYISEWTILNECKIKDMKCCIALTINALN